ncbi:RusA family crossover junction endodeoxyribonuclease [Virgibacillus siamensis]|uniref:RusA family crossover junction endodeoxyribonuclease n=1 Tax=Virgibacillus siamensis TaxID=480071 RepID=UPI000987877B|nr:RusA family crossover junction endodeoxyribonuclease [Virgibacillus siamensis]
MIKFTIPGDCVAQGRPRAVRMGKGIRLYDPKTSRDYKTYVARIAQEYAPKEPIETTLFVNLVIYRQIPKSTSKKKREQMLSGEIRPTVKPDIDNLSKGILDSLNGIIYKDDSQIVELNATKYYSDSPRAEIEIIEKW